MLQQLLSQQAPMSMALSNLYQTDLLQELSSQTWYTMDPSKAFNSGFSYGGSGACNGGVKVAKYMKAPYIQKTSTTIEADITGSASHHNACIYQSTERTCNFEGGGDGLTQLEFDY